MTMVAYHREEIFGRITNGKMELSRLGEMIHDEWMRSIGIRKEIRLFEDELVVMPNHIHAIVWIVGADGIRPVDNDYPGQGARRAPQPEAAPQPVDSIRPEQGVRRTPQRENTPSAMPQRKPRSFGAFIAGFKSSVTSRASRELQMTAIWQRNYFEHIIRIEKEFDNIWKYIDNNPHQWESDQLHPSAPPNQFNQGTT